MFAVQRAHENGVRVCLKPMVNCKDGAWRASIDFLMEIWLEGMYSGKNGLKAIMHLCFTMQRWQKIQV